MSQKAKYQRFVTPEKIDAFMTDLARRCKVEPEPSHAFDLARDGGNKLAI